LGERLVIADAVRSKEEIESAVRAFTPAQWIRLQKVAARYAPIGKLPPEDLLQEAFLRALDENGRKCPKHVDVVKFLAEAMCSIADGEGEKAENAAVLVTIGGDDDEEACQLADGTLSVEQRLVLDEGNAQMRRGLLALFDDDVQARDIVEGSIAGMTADELRELTGLDKTGYESKRKLIRRRTDKHYPDGWKP
jgi:hypothetical protein